MAEREFWLGSQGPYLYDDTEEYPGEPGVFIRAFRSNDATTGGSVIIGLSSTDLDPGTLLVVKGTIACVDAAANASPVMAMSAPSGLYGALSSGRSGSGAFLDMVFFTSATERMRIKADGTITMNSSSMTGLTSINAVFNNDEIVSNNDEMVFV